MELSNLLKFIKMRYLPVLLVALGLILQGCSYESPRRVNRTVIWETKNWRVNIFRKHFRGGTHVKISLQRAQQYLPHIHKVFQKYRLPPELAYLPILESGFDPKANSGRAVGMWQFTKATAKDYGMRVGWLRDDRLNWRKSTEAAAKYLSRLGKKFNYNWALALAAYNGGPGYIDKMMKRQHSWNFWKLRLRKETREYVPKFIAILQVSKRIYPDLYYKGAPRYWVASR